MVGKKKVGRPKKYVRAIPVHLNQEQLDGLDRILNEKDPDGEKKLTRADIMRMAINRFVSV